MKPYRCPICDGRGTVPVDFYALQRVSVVSYDMSETECKACDGKGIVWSDEAEIR